MSDYLKVKNRDGLYRDPSSGAIIAHDPVGYRNYRMKKQLAQIKEVEKEAQKNKINTIEERVEMLESKLDKIINLLENINGSD